MFCAPNIWAIFYELRTQYLAASTTTEMYVGKVGLTRKIQQGTKELDQFAFYAMI